MPRNVASSVENSFIRGLITEASGLNFPENACTDTYDCHFELTGEVRRRYGFDYETAYATKTIDRSSAAISSYLWKNVNGDGDVALWVLQVGGKLYFYDATASLGLSSGALSTTVTLSTYSPASAPAPDAAECQYSDGNGYLFVTHPNLNPFYVSFNSSTDTVTATQITIKIRDFTGIYENVDVDNRPATLTSTHKYNLANQGWAFSRFAVQSVSPGATTANEGSYNWTIGTGLSIAANDLLFAWVPESRTGNTAKFNYMNGYCTSYTSGTGALAWTCTSFEPAENAVSASSWKIASAPMPTMEMFQIAMQNYPSNADVWWLFNDANDQFNPGKTAPNVSRGTTPAPKGHYILELHNQDRATVSGISGPTTVTTSYYRPSTSAFFSGRVFYSGILYQDYTSSIYFTQILKPGQTDGFGKCYQANDPTSETLFDLLPNDGGVIVIPEAGTIIKLWAMQGGLVVFGTNGVWMISGSTGSGFTADDYHIRKISSVKALSATSFVDVAGFPAWWSAEGIYILQPDAVGSSVQIKSLTDESIATFYSEIPQPCKKQARGFFNLITKKINWLYRSTEAGTVEEIYEYDRILVWNARTTAFNPWTISSSDVKLHAVVVIDNSGGSIVETTVVDNSAVTVVDDAAATVVSYSLGSSVTAPVFKYLVSYPSGATDVFTVAEENSTRYLDWYTYDSTGVDYISYFVSGYKVHGQAQRKFQSNYIYLFSKEVPSEYNFQAMWDYANTGDSGNWSSQTHQNVTVTNTDYDVRRNRLKVRGEGLALQFKVYSETGQPFKIIGWSAWETGNATI